MSSFMNNETPPSNIVFLYKLNLKTPFLVHITCKKHNSLCDISLSKENQQAPSGGDKKYNLLSTCKPLSKKFIGKEIILYFILSVKKWNPSIAFILLG